MKTNENLNAVKSEMGSLNAKLTSLSEKELTLVSGGNDIDTGIQWNDPRCERAATFAQTFSNDFQKCYQVADSLKAQVKTFCDEFCMYIHTAEKFDQNKAMATYVKISAAICTHSMTPAANDSWDQLTLAFYSTLI